MMKLNVDLLRKNRKQIGIGAIFLTTLVVGTYNNLITAQMGYIEEDINVTSTVTTNFEKPEMREQRIVKDIQNKQAEEQRQRQEAEAKRLADIEQQKKNEVSQRGGNPNLQGTLAERALQQAKTKLGAPYVWGAVGPNTFDCSGLVQWAYKLQGKDIERTTYGQITEGVGVNRNDVRPGDLLLFSMHEKNDHIGIYYGDGQMLHAPHTGDVVKISEVPWSKLSAVRRIS